MHLHLFETLYASRETGLRRLDRHLARLAASARALQFNCNLETIRAEALRCEADLPPEGSYRVRICLEYSGTVEVQRYPLQSLPGETTRILLGWEWGFASTCSSNPLLSHKSSHREEYDRGWHFAESKGAFDLLFTNERGEITEGGRTNLFLHIGNRWWTPPVASGLLPGIMRAVLLEDSRFGAGEKVLFPEDLSRADQILLCNSLRGAMKAEFMSRVPNYKMA